MGLQIKDIPKEKLSPMMRQFVEIKERYPDCLILFRLGDFYETFFEDAELAAKELEIVLTSRDCGLEERAPMAGVPHHAIEQYLPRLLKRGYKVALVEQMEDPAQAKGLVEREVVRIVTPGTQTDQDALDASKNHYLLALAPDRYGYGLAAIELISGQFRGCSILSGSVEAKLLAELARFDPAEILLPNSKRNDPFVHQQLEERYAVSFIDDANFTLPAGDEEAPTPHFHLAEQEEGILLDNPSDASLASQKPLLTYLPELSLSDPQNLVGCAGAAILRYLIHTQFRLPRQLERMERYEIGGQLQLDESARRNLELFETVRERSSYGSLFWAVDRCETSMGRRLLRRWLDRPLTSVASIRERQDAVEVLKDDFMLRQGLRERLNATFDLERLAGKLDLGQGNARDLLSLARSLRQIEPLMSLLDQCEASGDGDPGLLKHLRSELNPLEVLATEIETALVDPAPISITEGGLIRAGYSPVLDEVTELSDHGQDWLLKLEAKEREETGIKNLKIGYNRVFAYYIEVSKSQQDKVPDRYIRKQTLTNAERYFTPELKEMEDKILGAQQRKLQLEYELFCALRARAASQSNAIRQNAEAIAQIDVLAGLAELADKENYAKPEVNLSYDLEIEGGRHPVVEKRLEQGAFVANDLSLVGEDERMILLTGPNMSGKSTYMRQTALIVILAQIGSFVPATRAQIGIVEQIFTRIGAADDLGAGESTFMVEMKEVANILQEADSRALLILDEIGRGTSTYDGLAIAWAVIEEILLGMPKGIRSLFATHYHELTDLEGQIAGLVNRHVQVQESQEDVIFLHRIASGHADRSYGIEVAKLAGVRSSVVERAKARLMQLEAQKEGGGGKRAKRTPQELRGQIDLFSSAYSLRQSDEIFEDLKNLDVDHLTPIDAWHKLDELSRKVRESERSHDA